MIDRDAIEAKARELEEALNEAGGTIRSKAMMSAAGMVGAVVFSFLAGRGRGRRKGARIEIHRL